MPNQLLRLPKAGWSGRGGGGGDYIPGNGGGQVTIMSRRMGTDAYPNHLPKTNSTSPNLRVMAPKSFSNSALLWPRIWTIPPTYSVWENKLVYHVVNSFLEQELLSRTDRYRMFERSVHFLSQSGAEWVQQLCGAMALMWGVVCHEVVCHLWVGVQGCGEMCPYPRSK